MDDGVSVDINGQMAREMERAYQKGYEDAQTGRHSFSAPVSSDPMEAVPVPSAQMNDRVLSVLHTIGVTQIGVRGQPLNLHRKVRAYYVQERIIRNPRRRAPDWQLIWKLGSDEPKVFGKPFSDRTIQLAVRAGLLHGENGDKPEKNFLILTEKGRATYLSQYVNLPR